MRGLSAGYTGKTSMALVFPRVRGVSVNQQILLSTVSVFPPSAGVIGANRKSGCLKNGIPPRMRGLSVRLLTEKWDLFVFPPHAGVIGRPGAQENWLNSIPPAYGGYRFHALRRWWSPRTPPACGGYWPVRILRNRCRAYSPRLRGLSGHEREPLRVCGVFPQHAGVST